MSSSDSEDDLITYGTALEPLEEDEIPCKKPRLLEDQVVTDKQGRRRFHGAFTGGFSAGFFNTVGSLEGWTPSLFKSSKSQKQEVFKQKPEDFMDEEDLSEFGIAPLVLKAKQDYTNEKSKNSTDFYVSPTIGTYVLDYLYKPVRETVGIKLLKKMGWKPGQGVGPRLNKNEKKDSLKMKQKTYGCQLPPGTAEEKDGMDSNSDSEWEEIEFAPSDFEPVLCEARNNYYGLGYQGLDKRLILSANPSKKKNFHNTDQNRKMAFGSQAFGVGAFEEEDEDIYAKDDMSRYDFSLGNDQALDSNKSPDKKLSTVDGIIEGFTFERTKRVRNKYPLPILPKDFKPRHKIRVSRFDEPSPSDKRNIMKGFHLNSEGRKQLIENASEITSVKKNKESEMLTKELISKVKINISNNFKPFLSNPDKQERYENYLKLIKIGKKERLSDLQPLSMTNWDREREKVEFEKAALLFKPLTGEMGDRFLTASQPDDLSDPLAVVEKFQDENDDTRKAAKMNMFGPLTRKTENWTPAQLLCRRFNIPEPTSGQPIPEKKKEKCYFNLFAAFESPKTNTAKVESEQLERNFENLCQAEIVESDSKKNESNDKNLNDVSDKADLFKAIFLASDDEDEKEDAEAKDDNKKEKHSEGKLSTDSEAKENFESMMFEEKLINSKRNTSPPKGIFENIDFELLSSARKGTTGVQSETVRTNRGESKEEVEKNSVPLELVYGPKIPEKTPVKVVACVTKNSPDDELWVEKKTHSKKHKKKKKSKKTSHKAKHKHKKHKRYLNVDQNTAQANINYGNRIHACSKTGLPNVNK